MSRPFRTTVLVAVAIAAAAAVGAACGSQGSSDAPAACAPKSDAATSACTTGTAGDGTTCKSESSLLAEPACTPPQGGAGSGIADRGPCGDGGAVTMRCLGCTSPCQAMAGVAEGCLADDTLRSRAAAGCARLGGGNACMTAQTVILGGDCTPGTSSRYVVSCCP